MASQIRIISSMATRQMLTDLAAQFHQVSPHRLMLESVGGVDAAKRVQAGEAFDVVVLAAHAIEQLIAAGRIVAASRVDLARSGVSVAVRAGAMRPDIGTEAALKQAILMTGSLGYSTGPSGTHLLQLFERWGITEQIKTRIIQAPPGVSVGSLVAKGEVELGFQQLSELVHLTGIEILGPLPPTVQIMTTFSAGCAAASVQADTVRELLAFLCAPTAAVAKRENGMEPA
jgi:molybdate transport system substrate-binding protein